jgi:hypothetical protein
MDRGVIKPPRERPIAYHGKEADMTLDTSVFRRIVEEAKAGTAILRKAAVKAVADTMEETSRFGSYSRPYIEACAKDRIEDCLKLAGQ